ncbi:MAG TPA: CPBP family intramembrane metalloprotease [Firmicutes bacterium]|nr:CPBP family intramembrane metalloprotease [Bacillota bacterium]
MPQADLASPDWRHIRHLDIFLTLLFGLVVVPITAGFLGGLFIRFLYPGAAATKAIEANRGLVLIAAGLIQEAFLVLLAVLLARRRLGRGDDRHGDLLADWLGLGEPPRFRYLILGTGLGFLLLLLEALGSGLSYGILFALYGAEKARVLVEQSGAPVWEWLRSTTGPNQRLALVVLLVVLGPLAEEIWFRGVVYPAWRARWGRWVALLVESAFFGLLHLNWVAWPALFLVGCALTLVYEHYRSLWPAVFAHAFLNGMVVLALLAQTGSSGPAV